MDPLLVFDLDGTLHCFNRPLGVDFSSSSLYSEIKRRAHAFLARRLNVSAADAKCIYELLDKDFNGAISLGVESRHGIDRYEWFENTWNLDPKDFIEKTDHLPLFNSLEAKVSILTGAPRIWASKVLDYLNLGCYQGALFTGEPNLRKPNPLSFRMVCDAIRIPPENAFSVGDQVISDILPAKRIGMKTVLVRGYSAEADYCIGSINELPALMRSIRQ
ncbi:MAG: HAD family hydrolase [archaeon]